MRGAATNIKIWKWDVFAGSGAERPNPAGKAGALGQGRAAKPPQP